MSESDDSKQRSEVDETQRQQDEEKIRTEGGPRLNGRLAAATVGIMMGLVVLLTLAVQSSGPRQSAQSGEASRDGDNTTADKTAVQDLIAHASEPTPAPLYQAPAMAPSSMVIPREQTAAPAAPRQPSRYARVGAGQVHEGAGGSADGRGLPRQHAGDPIALAERWPERQQPEPGQSSPPAAEGAAVRLHPPASPYTVMAGGVIPAVLVSGINSDLPGPILAQVSQNVYDTASGHVAADPAGEQADRLIPQLGELRAEPGSDLVGPSHLSEHLEHGHSFDAGDRPGGLRGLQG